MGPELTNHNEFGNKQKEDDLDNPDSEEPELLLNRKKYNRLR